MLSLFLAAQVALEAERRRAARNQAWTLMVFLALLIAVVMVIYAWA
jgi:predicted nucleic acid-binding Zn ribbon protein